MEYTYLFDDKWVMSVWHNFSILLVMIPGIIGTVLKLIAKIHPGVPTDEILDLVKIIFTKPGERAQ